MAIKMAPSRYMSPKTACRAKSKNQPKSLSTAENQIMTQAIMSRVYNIRPPPIV